jgi:predicted RNase H-like nuclease (RuvC/YqgF family)
VPMFVTLLCGRMVLAQSLAEAARREAERRKSLEQQGIEGKVISAESLGRNLGAAVSTSKLPATGRKPVPGRPSAENRRSVASYRSALLRLDRNIRQCEDRLAALKRRYEEEKDTLPRSGRMTSRMAANSTRERLRRQIEELQIRLRRLRQDRLEAYDAGRKAGFMPGELDGHGIVP